MKSLVLLVLALAVASAATLPTGTARSNQGEQFTRAQLGCNCTLYMFSDLNAHTYVCKAVPTIENTCCVHSALCTLPCKSSSWLVCI
jgi:hypothetical protein